MLAQAFAGRTAGSVMHPIIDAVPGSMHVSTMVDVYAMGHDLRTQAVEVDGRVVGVIGRAELDSAAPARWVSTAVTRLMTRIGPDDIVDVDEPLENLIIRPVGHAGRIVVVDEGLAVGIIEPRDLATENSYA
jgi:predicted transcriptional regulator